MDQAQCGAPNCMHDEEDGYPLLACSACKMANYCSKECQKKAWPTHKEACKANQALQRSLAAQGPDAARVLSCLTAWLDTRRALLNRGLVAFLNLSEDPLAHEKRALHIEIEYLPGKKPTESFRLRKMQGVPLDALARQGGFDEALTMRKRFDDEAKEDPDGYGNGLIFLVVKFGAGLGDGFMRTLPQTLNKSDARMAPDHDWAERFHKALDDAPARVQDYPD